MEHSRKIPERMFAFGEEPVGVRVTPYHKPLAIRKILRALEVDEVEVLRRSPFGKLVEIAEKPTFSGRFGRYIISRQLKVKKKHEAWFLFSGKPIRFYLREFAIVTGMSCGKYPARSKKKRDINEKPYWAELFGTLKEAPVSSILRMLKKKRLLQKIQGLNMRTLPSFHQSFFLQLIHQEFPTSMRRRLKIYKSFYHFHGFVCLLNFLSEVSKRGTKYLYPKTQYLLRGLC